MKKLTDNLYINSAGEIRAMAGSNINPTIKDAIEVARITGELTVFEFNGVNVTVAEGSDAELIFRDWNRALNGYIDKAVGPLPKETLSEEEIENDKRIEAENERRRQESQAKWEAKAKAKREAFEAKLSTAPEMEFSDADGWATFVEINSKDAYSNGVVVYCERWARLMQQEIDNGAELKDIADSTSRAADVDGITRFMYGAAVNTLAHCWIYGEELRRWHNSSYGEQGEKANESGGTINPAVLTIAG